MQEMTTSCQQLSSASPIKRNPVIYPKPAGPRDPNDVTQAGPRRARLPRQSAIRRSGHPVNNVQTHETQDCKQGMAESRNQSRLSNGD